MKAKISASALLLCLLLTGCSWTEGSYVSVTPHQEHRTNTQTAVISASDYLQLTEALTEMIADGIESAAINVAEYPTASVESGMAVAVRYAMENDPVGAYAVESIEYELGTSGGQPALAVKIRYRHSRMEIQRIHRIKDMEEVRPIVESALKAYDSDVVLLAQDYRTVNFPQMVAQLAQTNPQTVMETPQVSVSIYGTGMERVVEVKFAYQTARETLRQMQNQVKPVFDAAVLYVSGDSSDWQKYSQLYAFLMERFDYRMETSITPAYSLLRHGEGDSRAFATVYAAMCRAAGLECLVVTGSYGEEEMVWNMVLDDGQYYHVDLLRCSEEGRYLEKTDSQMYGYQWDSTAYPLSSGGPEKLPEETAETAAEEPAE